MSQPQASPDCPAAKLLDSWLQGKSQLTQKDMAHIADCAYCESQLEILSDDQGLRGSILESTGQGSEFVHESEFEALQQNLANLGSATIESDDQKDDSNTRASLKNDSTVLDADSHDETVIDNDGLTPRELQQLLHDRIRSTGKEAARYLVSQKLASGGAGSVYLAFDRQLAREVAIKVLRNDSQRDRQRFLREAKVLAQLDHPHIVQIFDSGDLPSDKSYLGNNGPLYLVMEYMAGGSSIQLAKHETASADGTPSSPRSESMAYKDLAMLLAGAARGLAAAHSQGLVHRDIKPDNLLLSETQDRMKVADFGLARELGSGSTVVTRTGDIVGTPAYMSPEHVSTQEPVSVQSDVYSFGAAMYTLLTGQLPFQGPPAAVLRQLAESTPTRPRLINPRVPRDLEVICEKAMHRLPGDRYRNAATMADDLERFANGQPIQARPLSSATRAIYFLRQNPGVAAALGITMTCLTLLLVGSIAATVIYSQQNRRLTEAISNEAQARSRSDAALVSAIEAADELLLTVTSDAELLPRTPGSQEVSRKLLARAKDYFQEFLRTNKENPRLSIQLARAHAGLAKIAAQTGASSDVRLETDAALANLDSLPTEEQNTLDAALLRVNARLVLANHLIDSGNASEALPILETALEFSQPYQDQSSDDEFLHTHALTLYALANAHNWLGETDEALVALGQAQAHFASLHATAPTPIIIRDLATCEITAGTIALDRNDPSEGKARMLNALTLFDEIGSEDAISLRTREIRSKVLTNLALAESRMGNYEASSATYDRAIAETRRLMELEPGVPAHQWNLVVASMNSGSPALQSGQTETLVENWEASLEVLNGLIESEPDNARYVQVKAMLQSNLAIVLRDMGKLAESVVPLTSATQILLEQAESLNFAAESYLPVALNYYELASTFSELEEWEQALVRASESAAICEQILERDAEFTPAKGLRLDLLLLEAEVASASDRPADALGLARQAVDLVELLVRENPEVAEYKQEQPVAWLSLATAQLAEGQTDECLDSIEAIRKLWDLEHIGTRSKDTTANGSRSMTDPQIEQLLRLEAQALVVSLENHSGLNENTQGRLRRLIAESHEKGLEMPEIAQLEKHLESSSD